MRFACTVLTEVSCWHGFYWARAPSEYDLYRQLMNKLKVKGLNAIFDLRIQISVGDTMIVAVASGTAAYLVALPPPQVLEVRRASGLLLVSILAARLTRAVLGFSLGVLVRADSTKRDDAHERGLPAPRAVPAHHRPVAQGRRAHTGFQRCG